MDKYRIHSHGESKGGKSHSRVRVVPSERHRDSDSVAPRWRSLEELNGPKTSVFKKQKLTQKDTIKT